MAKVGRPPKQPAVLSGPGHVSQETLAKLAKIDKRPDRARPRTLERIADEYLFGSVKRPGRPSKAMEGILSERARADIAYNEVFTGDRLDLCKVAPGLHTEEGGLIR